jgi:putative Mn2+ efflux pump MntP
MAQEDPGSRMNLITVLGIAFGLSMDAVAVSITCGWTIRDLRIRHALRIALFFGTFQAVMPLLGWTIGIRMRSLIENVDHWVAFGLLTGIGVKMIVESLRKKPEGPPTNPLHLPVLLVLSLATSIDALAVGIGFALLSGSIIAPIAIIGLVTFVLSFIGVYAGGRFGHLIGKKLEIVGGMVLIGIGIKILVEHISML